MYFLFPEIWVSPYYHMVIIKHYTIIANFKNICVGLLYFDRNINILYISLKILLFTTKRTFKFWVIYIIQFPYRYRSLAWSNSAYEMFLHPSFDGHAVLDKYHWRPWTHGRFSYSCSPSFRRLWHNLQNSTVPYRCPLAWPHLLRDFHSSIYIENKVTKVSVT